MVLVFIFVLGLIIGSFLNAVIWRLDRKESVLQGRSKCPKCKHELFFQDLIPLVSFVFLRGRCRYCKKPISFQYPLVELASALMFVLLFLQVGFNLFTLVSLWFLASSLLVIFVYDVKHFLIPDVVLFPAILVAVVWQFLEGQLLSGFIAGIGAGAFFLFLFLISRGKWMGFGDVKLALLLGLILGFPVILVGLFIAFLVGAVFGVGLVIGGKKSMRSEVPFAPFLIGGTAFAFVWGEVLMDWYFTLLVV